MDLKLGDTQKLIDEAKKLGVLRNQLAYVLATAYHESGHTMKPVREAFWLSEAWRKKNLRYYPWYGRGYVQLTWDYNYKKASEKIGVDLMKDPDLAMMTDNAVKIILWGMIEGWFTGKKLSDYITLMKSDFINARYIINGKDKRDLIAAYARDYDADLKRIGYGVTK